MIFPTTAMETFYLCVSMSLFRNVRLRRSWLLCPTGSICCFHIMYFSVPWGHVMRTCVCVIHCSAKEDEKSFLQRNVCPLGWGWKNTAGWRIWRVPHPLFSSFLLLDMHQSLIYNILGASLEECGEAGFCNDKSPKEAYLRRRKRWG